MMKNGTNNAAAKRPAELLQAKKPECAARILGANAATRVTAPATKRETR